MSLPLFTTILKPAWRARKILFVVTYLALILTLAISFVLPARVSVEPAQMDLPADGISRALVRVQVHLFPVRKFFFPHPFIKTQVLEGAEFIQMFPPQEFRLTDRGAQAFIKSRAVEGQALIRFSVHHATPAEIRVITHAVLSDQDQDGFPDAMRLTSFTDRENFRRALAAIAELQFYGLSDAWAPEQRDSSGLVRFSIREALRRHTDDWMTKFRPPISLPSVEKYNFPNTPLGEKIFRTRDGVYREEDIANGALSESVDAGVLKQFNTNFVSRDPAQAQKGDLLFFYQPSGQRFSYHVMMVLKDAVVNPDGNNDWVVYHTGPTAMDAGEVKKVRLATLQQRPDARWRPAPSNKNFIGVFRLKIVR